MKYDNPILNGYLYKKIEAAERLDEMTPFTTEGLQKALLIGYGQAAQIVDLFVKLGIVSICDEDGNRHTLVSPREAAIRVIRYLHGEFTEAAEEFDMPCLPLQNAWDEEDLPELFISDDSLDGDDSGNSDNDPNRLNEEVLTDIPTSRLNDKELLRKAVEAICSFKRIGTSHLQRYLGIGYGRAAHMIDTLESLGIVGADPGNKRGREVLLSLEDALTRIESYLDEET